MVDSIVRTNEMMTLPLEHGVCRTILPKQPSLLLRVAIMDARTLNRTMYSPQWARYHEPNRGGGPCWVCFAGAAMAGSLGVAHDKHVRPEDLGANKDQLRALDSMRDGEWREAFAQLGIPPDLVPHGLSRGSSRGSHRLFHSWGEFDRHLAWQEAHNVPVLERAGW